MTDEYKTKLQLISQLSLSRQRVADLEQSELAHMRAKENLKKSLKKVEKRAQKMTALLKASKSVLENKEFESAAKEIFCQCKTTTGAHGGYVALFKDDGSEHNVLFRDAGGLPCAADPNFPMPIRGMREEAYKSGKTIYRNDFSNSEQMQFLSEAYAKLDNVMFAPFSIAGNVVGLIGLANKPGGFDDKDARIASGFGEIVAVALHNGITLESLRNSEIRFRSVVQIASDAVISINQEGKIVLWNRGAERIFNYTADEMVDRDLSIIMPHRYIKLHREAVRKAINTGLKHEGEVLELSGLKKDGSEFPVELTVTKWQTREGIVFTSIIRDITDRKRAEQAVIAAHADLERLVALRTATLAETNRRLLVEIKERRKSDAARNDAEEELAMESRQLAETNTALRVLLHRREEDLKETEQKIVANIQKLVLPYFEELRKLPLSPSQSSCLDIMNANLQQVINPFLQNLAARFSVFTPREIQVSNLIKEGKTNKEIADLIKTAPRSVEFHRNNIRKKLGLRGKKITLRSFLLTLS